MAMREVHLAELLGSSSSVQLPQHGEATKCFAEARSPTPEGLSSTDEESADDAERWWAAAVQLRLDAEQRAYEDRLGNRGRRPVGPSKLRFFHFKAPPAERIPSPPPTRPPASGRGSPLGRGGYLRPAYSPGMGRVRQGGAMDSSLPKRPFTTSPMAPLLPPICHRDQAPSPLRPVRSASAPPTIRRIIVTNDAADDVGSAPATQSWMLQPSTRSQQLHPLPARRGT